MTVTIGVAIGQRRRATALCVVERQEREADGEQRLHHSVRWADRLPPATPYPEVAERLGRILAKVRRKTGSEASVFVDVTGLGEPVVELLKEKAHGVTLTACYFTHGDSLTKEDRGLRLGKGHLVAKLQTLLQSGRLHLPKTPEVETMTRELLAYDVQIEPDANERYGAFTVGTQDELVTALGLAVCPKPPPEFRIY